MRFQIKEARELAGFSQKELAKIVGVAPSTFNGYESGNHDPKSEILIKIADVCNVTVDFLLGIAENEKSPDTTEAAPGEDHIIALYRELNHEGREKLIDYADDLVSSGKYIKSDPPGLGKEA